MRSTTTAAAVLAAAPLAYGWNLPNVFKRQNDQCDTITTEEIKNLPNNALFTRWRSQSHFIAPAGWMNDPAGFMYDPVRDEYHGHYQWHPNHINWGNISWGGAVSKDLINWEDQGGWRDAEALALGPTGNGSHDGLGIFSGSALSVNLQGEQDGTLLLFYTGAQFLPTKWLFPYTRGTESQSMALSTDGGKTWERLENNPVINASTNEPPMNWDLTGFRDPFIEPNPELDALRGVEKHFYSVWGSGIKGVGPRMPLWAAPANDLTNWTFLGSLWEPAQNTSLGPILSTGQYAYNFELSGFFRLKDRAGEDHWYTNMGTEGGGGPDVPFHTNAQWQLWNEGEVVRRQNGSVEFIPTIGGAGDWGLGYAATSFNDTKNNRRVQYAWIKEDNLGDQALFSAPQQGFQGALTIPRELFVHEVDGVTNTTELTEAKFVTVKNGTAFTLGVRPVEDVADGLREVAAYSDFAPRTYDRSTILQSNTTSHVNIKATVKNATGPVGLTIGASPDGEEFTNIIYEPSNYTILVDRRQSTTMDLFNRETITGYFQPYKLLSTNETEEISFDVWVDGSAVEIYVNERFALSARIYPSKTCSTGWGVFVGEDSEAEFGKVEAWDGTKNVWPQRPANSSSELVIDTPEETNNGAWWIGN
ncbi:Extracellular exo-inulinase inuE [Cercospora beticola]|uniref:Extracellular exo-inulinase inuE n=1 Tax=Cercospora beticola TaxID=122368 RepID=A0A2G5HI25_CERBT|nr:Extracellular exo-inulinase inuE [Cercospora beticola]PIA92188.1 Extracellular exo-inulinase inuE [Cercospora beticola]WPB06057.1 hypothetical protein RHO25_010714 [Cercospora beticola]CAK1365941.1 unnamed protein product [Cercospora beticola]